MSGNGMSAVHRFRFCGSGQMAPPGSYNARICVVVVHTLRDHETGLKIRQCRRALQRAGIVDAGGRLDLCRRMHLITDCTNIWTTASRGNAGFLDPSAPQEW